MSMTFALLPAARKARKEEIASIHAGISILEIERRRAALKATKGRALSNDGITQLMSTYAIA